MGVVTFGSRSYKSGIPAKSGRTHRVTTVPSGTSVGSARTSQGVIVSCSLLFLHASAPPY